MNKRYWLSLAYIRRNSSRSRRKARKRQAMYRSRLDDVEAGEATTRAMILREAARSGS